MSVYPVWFGASTLLRKYLYYSIACIWKTMVYHTTWVFALAVVVVGIANMADSSAKNQVTLRVVVTAFCVVLPWAMSITYLDINVTRCKRALMWRMPETSIYCGPPALFVAIAYPLFIAIAAASGILSLDSVYRVTVPASLSLSAILCIAMASSITDWRLTAHLQNHMVAQTAKYLQWLKSGQGQVSLLRPTFDPLTDLESVATYDCQPAVRQHIEWQYQKLDLYMRTVDVTQFDPPSEDNYRFAKAHLRIYLEGGAPLPP